MREWKWLYAGKFFECIFLQDISKLFFQKLDMISVSFTKIAGVNEVEVKA